MSLLEPLGPTKRLGQLLRPQEGGNTAKATASTTPIAPYPAGLETASGCQDSRFVALEVPSEKNAKPDFTHPAAHGGTCPDKSQYLYTCGSRPLTVCPGHIRRGCRECKFIVVDLDTTTEDKSAINSSIQRNPDGYAKAVVAPAPGATTTPTPNGSESRKKGKCGGTKNSLWCRTHARV